MHHARMAAFSLPSHHGIVKHLQELHRAGCTGQWVASQLLNAFGVLDLLLYGFQPILLLTDQSHTFAENSVIL